MSNVIQINSRTTGGFTRMDNDLYEALIGADLSGRELRVAMAIHRLTSGYNKDSVKVAALYVAKMMYGDSAKAEAERANVSRAINSLIRQRVIFRDGGSRDPIEFLPVSEWKIDSNQSVLKSTHCVEKVHATVSKSTHIKERNTNTTSNEVVVDAERQPDLINPAPEKVIRHTPVVDACPYQEIVALYHMALPELPAVALLNAGRKKTLQARWRESAVHRDLGFWAEYFAMVKASHFLTGKAEGRNGSKPFRASFDWLIAPSNFVKVVEGNYNA
ncbi:replication protein [Pseudomonas folii]|uniref:Replication protein n=1 Tax=Pseudomonas folii TaxID=2762593 RepID=A0ABR7ATT3_9PSED|nr:replication protein [Pseudomonas folii]MBC3948328.1 replication protein [Pseudomonas folii]